MNPDWLNAAMADDTLVAALLLRLNPLPPRLPPRSWGVRLPRSTNKAKADHDAARRSPTTPLSWTTTTSAAAAASPSDTSEESSRPLDPLLSSSRFKGNATNDTTNSGSGSKRSRKKKTFAELKEEESSLLKERKHLNEELESLRMKFEEHRSSNEKLKRIKLDLHAKVVPKPLPTVNEASTSEAAATATSNVSKRVKCEEVSADLCAVQNGSSNERPVFELPDLNMMPEEGFALEGAVQFS